MREIIRDLTLEERAESDKFLARLSAAERANVEQLVRIADEWATDYFEGDDADRHTRDFTSQNSEQMNGYPFFAVYGIGGILTKEGERPDIDLLVVTNAVWNKGYTYKREEHFMRHLLSRAGGNYYVKTKGELPDDYNVGLTQGKTKITLTPRKKGGKKIDITYVRSRVWKIPPSIEPWDDEFEEVRKEIGTKTYEWFFVSEEEFKRKDVNSDGQPLPKALLYMAKSTDVHKPLINWTE